MDKNRNGYGGFLTWGYPSYHPWIFMDFPKPSSHRGIPHHHLLSKANHGQISGWIKAGLSMPFSVFMQFIPM